MKNSPTYNESRLITKYLLTEMSQIKLNSTHNCGF